MPAFRASARTVDLLGRQQIAGIPTGISELFKNAHDAYAENVEVDLIRPSNLLVLRDNGIGMTEQDFVLRWLTLGTDSKHADSRMGRPDRPTGSEERPVLGEKGIGRLAIASIGPQVLVVSRSIRDGKLSAPIAALINWTLFEIPGINLDDVIVPMRVLEPGQLPTRELVEQMADEIRANVTSLAQAGSALAKRTCEQLDGFTLDPVALDTILGEPSLTGDGHGTHFFVSPVEESLTTDLDAERAEWGASDVKRTLVGFANTMTPGHDDKRLASAFRDHRSAELVTDVIGDEEFFTPEEFRGADHHIRGQFDEFGQFNGTVTVFDRDPEEHVVPWPDARGRKLDCGPFRLDLAIVQGDPHETLLPRESWLEITQKMNAIGGLYIYRDGIRVLPYGNANNDFLEIERNRTKQASRYYFSYRRMFGVIELNGQENQSLQEKAGREGFLDNRAYRQFRNVLKNFFVRTAYDFFAIEGSASDPYQETRSRLKDAHTEAERQAKLKRQRARSYARDLDDRFALINSGQPERDVAVVLANLDSRLLAATLEEDVGKATDEFVAAEIDARRSLDALRGRYRLPAPRGLGLPRSVRNESTSYAREFARIEAEVVRPAAEHVEKLVAERAQELKLALDRRLRLEALVDDVAQRAKSVVGRSAKEARAGAHAVLDGVTGLTTQSRRAIEIVVDEVRTDLARLDVGSIDESALVAHGLRLEELLDETAAHELELLDAVTQQLKGIATGRDNGVDAIAALEVRAVEEDRVLALQDRSDADLEMAAQGLALQVINHEFAHTIGAVRENLRRLHAWGRMNAELSALYSDLRASFDHLDSYLRLFTPMQRRLNRRREVITGADVMSYLVSVFQRQIDELEADGVSPLSCTADFRSYEWVGFKSTFYPAFVNLVDNALYWAARGSGGPAIVLGAKGATVTVSDNGPGIEARHREDVFEMGWTLKPGGRGAGLSISRQTLAAEGWKLEILPVKSGACFGISPNEESGQ